MSKEVLLRREVLLDRVSGKLIGWVPFWQPQNGLRRGGQKRPRADLEMVRGGAPATYSKTYSENTQFKP